MSIALALAAVPCAACRPHPSAPAEVDARIDGGGAELASRSDATPPAPPGWVDTRDGDGKHMVARVPLRKLDPRARSVVLRLAPHDERTHMHSGGGLAPVPCSAGEVVAEIPRAAYDVAQEVEGDVQVYLRVRIPVPDRNEVYTLAACVRDAEGRLFSGRGQLASVVSPAPKTDGRPEVLTPSGLLSPEQRSPEVVVAYDVAGQRLVEARVTRRGSIRSHWCVTLGLEDGRLINIRRKARFWVPNANEFREGERIEPGDELLTASLERVRVVAREASDDTCAWGQLLDVAWPDTYFEGGILVHDMGRGSSRPPASVTVWQEPSLEGAPVVAQPAPWSSDCQLGVRLDVRDLDAGTRAVAISARPHVGLRGRRSPADCDSIIAEVPRALLSFGRSFDFFINSRRLECEGEYAVVACLRDSAGALRAAEPLARFGKAGPVCLAEGTLVDTAAGLRPVETLDESTVVRAMNPEDGASLLVPVRRVRPQGEQLVATFELTNGRTLRVTAAHPIYVVERGGFVPARQIGVGATLLSPGGAPVAVLSRTPFDEPARVYDITVGPPHTYLAAGVLVHNY